MIHGVPSNATNSTDEKNSYYNVRLQGEPTAQNTVLEEMEKHPTRRYLTTTILIFLVGIGLGIRAWRLGSVPGPFADEVLSAQSLHTLFTRRSNGLLSIITPILDGRALVKLADGSRLIDLRVVALTFGIGTIVVVMMLTIRVYGRIASIVGGCAAAVMPWAIYYSRIFFPASEYLFFSILMVYACIRILDQHSNDWLLVACVAGAVTIYIYPAAIVSTPLLLLSIATSYRKSVMTLSRSTWLAAFIVFIILIVPYIIGHLLDIGSSVTTMNNVIGSRQLINSGLPLGAEIRHFVDSYMSYFSISYLALHGDPNPVQSIQAVGEIGPILCIVGIVGMVVCLRKIRQPRYLLVLMLLMLYPIADALTLQNSMGNSDVAVLGVIPWSLLIGIGGDSIVSWTRDCVVSLILQQVNKVTIRKNRGIQAETGSYGQVGSIVALGGVLLLLISQLFLFLPTYFGVYDATYAYRFEYGFANIVNILKESQIYGLPVTVDAGYERAEMYSYFNDNRLDITSVYQSCYPLPINYAHYAVAEQVLVIREGRDYGADPGCINQLSLIPREIHTLEGAGRKVRVLKIFSNDPGQLSGPRYKTAVLLIEQ